MAKKIAKLMLMFVAAFSFVFCGATVFAEDEKTTETPAVWLQISPVSNRIALEPGQTIDATFMVENIGSGDFDYKVYATPYYVSNESYDLSFSTENTYTQIARWVTFRNAEGNYVEEASFHLAVGEKQTIHYRVTTPNDVPAGGQYATLFAESIDNSTDHSATGIKTISRVGLVLYANANGETRQAADITDYDFTKFLLSGNLKAQAKITNSGNTDFSASYTYTVKTLFGKELYSDTQSYFVLPETTRAIDVEWAETPFMGIFQVSYRVNALNNTEEQTRVVLVMPVFVAIIALLLLTIIIIWIIILIRKRKERKSRLLV